MAKDKVTAKAPVVKATEAAGEVKKADSAVPNVEQKQIVSVGVDRTNEQIVNLNVDAGIELKWDKIDFRKLPVDVVNQLTRQNLINYIRADTDNQAMMSGENGVKYVAPVAMLDPLGMYSQSRMQSLEPKSHMEAGWHLCWSTPGLDFDTKMNSGYRQVRKQKDGEDKPVGEENGEVIKLMDSEGKVEMILLEVDKQRYERHLQFLADKSRDQFLRQPDEFEETLNGLNASSGVRREDRAKVIREDRKVFQDR